MSTPTAPRLPFGPELPPMLARLARELPEDGFLYEPKWDGFRSLALRSGSDVALQSRHGRPLARYFPELVEAIGRLPTDAVAAGDAGALPAGPDAVLARLAQHGDLFRRVLEE